MMQDIFPFPRITSNTSEGQIAELTSYLIQFKETLEFALMNISYDNLSPALVEKLNSLGADIEITRKSQEDELAQVSNKSLTVSDVINSKLFQDEVDNRVIDISFTVNFDTGKLEYSKS